VDVRARGEGSLEQPRHVGELGIRTKEGVLRHHLVHGLERGRLERRPGVVRLAYLSSVEVWVGARGWAGKGRGKGLGG